VEEESGFTLIELLVVVMIIGILIALALPTYQGAQARAADRAVQTNLRNAFTATRIYYAQERAFSDTPADLAEIEPTLEWTNAPLDETSSSTAVYVEVDGDDQIVLGGRTDSGWCFYLKDVVGGVEGGTYYDSAAADDGTCTPPAPSVIDEARWSGRTD
jgi:type IV pilus assembly protein PilA